MSRENEKKAKPAFEIACRHAVKRELEEYELIEENRMMATIQSNKHLGNELR